MSLDAHVAEELSQLVSEKGVTLRKLLAIKEILDESPLSDEPLFRLAIDAEPTTNDEEKQ